MLAMLVPMVHCLYLIALHYDDDAHHCYEGDDDHGDTMLHMMTTMIMIMMVMVMISIFIAMMMMMMTTMILQIYDDHDDHDDIMMTTHLFHHALFLLF